MKVMGAISKEVEFMEEEISAYKKFIACYAPVIEKYQELHGADQWQIDILDECKQDKAEKHAGNQRRFCWQNAIKHDIPTDRPCPRQ